MDHIAYIGIGSNLGDRRKNCILAIEAIGKSESLRVEAVSKWRETQALTLGGEEGLPYVNGAAKIATNLSPHGLLKALKDIECRMGRDEKHQRWSPRPIDLDILFYDDLVLDENGLAIPHSEIPKRLFVLEPLCDMEPKLLHPVLKATVLELHRRIA